MFCKVCGQALSPDAGFCPNCGAAVQSTSDGKATPEPPAGEQYGYAPPYSRPRYPFAGQGYPAVPPKPSMTWLIVNIVLTVLSGLSNLLAIIGLIFGVLGQSAYTKGDYADAVSKTKVCKTLGIVSLALFLVALVVVVILCLAAGLIAGFSGAYS